MSNLDCPKCGGRGLLLGEDCPGCGGSGHRRDYDDRQRRAHPLLALTLHRPWPVLIARGIKKIENRPWHPEPRLQPGEWFAVHAGKKYDDRCTPMAIRLGYPPETFLGQPANLAGCIVAVARYAGYTRASEDPWFFGPPQLGWILDQVVAIDPIPCKGAQQLWRVPDPTADLVRGAFKRARDIAAPAPPP